MTRRILIRYREASRPASGWRWLLTGLCLLLVGCSAGYSPLQVRADVDSLAASSSGSAQRFVILPGNAEINEKDLQFQEFRAYAERALIARGHAKANTLEEGDVVVFLSYGVGSPETRQYAYDVPVWGDVGYYYYQPYYRRSRLYPGYGMGVMGYTQRIESYVSYKRYAVLDAYAMKPYLQRLNAVQLWKTNAESHGASNDLRLVFPYLVAAMQPYIGSNTGHRLTVDVTEGDSSLQQVLGVPSSNAQQSGHP